MEIALTILGIVGLASLIELFKWVKKWFYKPNITQIIEYISVCLFNDALQACNNEYPKVNRIISKATILSYKGLVYNKLARQKNVTEVDYDLNYYNKALVEYIKALKLLQYQKHLKSKSKRLCLLTILCAMVDIYLSLYELKGEKEILKEVNKYIDEYDKYKDKSTALHLNGMILIHKARLHRKMYLIEKDIKYIEMAIGEYKEAINILVPEKDIEENRFPYYLAHQNLSNAQHDLAKFNNDIELLIEAEKNQSIAIDYFKEFPEDHARSCMNLATIYIEISGFKNSDNEKEIYLEKALTLLKIAEEIYDSLGIRYGSYSVKRNISNYYSNQYDVKNDPTSILLAFQYLNECQEICIQIKNVEALCETISLKILIGHLCINYNPNIVTDLFDSYNKLLYYGKDQEINEEPLLILLCECAFSILLNFDNISFLEKAKQLCVNYKTKKESFCINSYIYIFNLILEFHCNGVDSAKTEIEKQLNLLDNMDSIDISSEDGNSFLKILHNIRAMARHINTQDKNELELARIENKTEEIAKKVFNLESLKFVADDDICKILNENGIDNSGEIRIEEIPDEILEKLIIK